MKKENLEIADQHIELAEQILLEESRDATTKNLKKLKDASFALEKAETNIEELEEKN